MNFNFIFLFFQRSFHAITFATTTESINT